MWTRRIYQREQRKENLRILLVLPLILIVAIFGLFNGQNHKYPYRQH